MYGSTGQYLKFTAPSITIARGIIFNIAIRTAAVTEKN